MWSTALVIVRHDTHFTFSPGTPVFSTNKADLYDITEILLRVALTTTTLTHDPIGKIDPYMQVKCVSCLTITNAVDHISLDSVKTYHKMEILTRKFFPIGSWVRVVVVNATLNNISVIS
jgi:hypothetical protein